MNPENGKTEDLIKALGLDKNSGRKVSELSCSKDSKYKTDEAPHFSTRYGKDTRPSYGAFVVEDNCVLMILAGAGWSCPKGHIEEGETPGETAVREVFEETGIRISVDTDKFVTVESARPQDNRTIRFFKGQSLEGKKTPIVREVKDARWVPLEEAKKIITNGQDTKVFELLDC